MTETKTSSLITTERDFHNWLQDQGIAKRNEMDAQTRSGNHRYPQEDFRDGGISCLDYLRQWEAGYRYIAVSFESELIRFNSLPACNYELGVVVAVEVVDHHRFDLVAASRGYL